MNLFLAGGMSGNLSPFYQNLTGGGNLDEAIEKMNVFLAGNDGYHKNEEWLKEAQNEMKKNFLAGSESRLRWVTKEVTNFEDFNILESYYTLRDNEDFLRLLTRCNSFLLDSGAFTFMQGTHQGEIDWDRYIEEYADLINRWDIKLFFELDIDSIVGLDEVNRLRKKLEALTNKQPIPVWHKNRGKDYFIRMCEEYPYVAIGGIVTREIPKNIYEQAFPWFIKTAHEHGCKIHGLGISKIARVVGYCSARLQLQERLARDIMQMLSDALSGQHQGMALVMKGTHLCKSMRGVKSQGEMSVSVLTGLFKSEPDARREFYKLIDAQKR